MEQTTKILTVGKRVKLRTSFKLSTLYSKTCVKRPLSKRPKHAFQDRLSFNADQKYCIKTFVMSILSDRFTQVLLYMKNNLV